MKRILGLLLIASIGGLVALGLNRLFKEDDTSRFESNYLARYTSLQDTDRPDFVAVAELVTPTVVHIITTVNPSQGQSMQIDPFGGFFKGFEMPQVPRSGSGSGVIIRSDGYIVTNNHVVEGASKIKVILNDKREYDAELLGTDRNTDLALLRIEEKNLPFAVVGNSDEVKVGQWVLAVGNPFNLTSTVTAGIVSAKGRGLNLLRDPRNPETQYAIEAFIQTDAAVNPGNSGGALVSTSGKLIGINSAIASETGQFAGYSFAIPSNLMKKVVDDLMNYGTVQRGLLGVQIQDMNNQIAEKEGLTEVKGVYVAKVTENSAAEAAGMKDGDIILTIDGEAVNSSNELQEKVGQKSPGDKVTVGLLRKGKAMEVSATLRGKDGKTTVVKNDKIETNKVLDCEFESLSREDRLKLKVSGGVRVKKVGDKSPLRKVGVPNGFVLTTLTTNEKKAITTVGEVKQMLEGYKGDVQLVGINPDGSKGYYGFGVQ